MKNRPDIIALLLLIVLTALTAAQQVFIVPVVRDMLATASVPVSLPGRIFIAASRGALWEFAALLLVTVLALRRLHPRDDRARQAQVLNVASIAMALILLGQAALFVNLARSTGRAPNSGGQETASTAAAVRR